MAPFRRGRSATSASSSQDGLQRERSESAWEARRRRRNKQAVSSNTSRRKDDLPADEYDPYDSDPGESYREHCERIKGNRMRSCLTMPRFLLNSKISNEVSTEATSPPSPLTSSDLDPEGAPASLPRDLARVRYSLRSAISDGSQAQDPNPSLMDRRDLRPNNIHINVSHWSEFGGRDYMEDR